MQRSVGLWTNAVLSGGGVVINTGFSMNFRNMPTWNNTQQEQSEGRQEDGHREILARVYFGKLWLLELKCRSLNHVTRSGPPFSLAVPFEQAALTVPAIPSA